MYLTKDEEKMLSGKEGEGYRRAMDILVKMGDYYGAKRMVPLSWSNVVGTGTDSPERDMLKFLESFVDQGVTFKCPIVLAMAGRPGVSDFNQKMGAQLTYGGGGSPHDLYPLPVFGQYIIGGGTNVNTLCNGIIGARANSEGPIGQYVGSIAGVTPEYGYLLDENRVGKMLVEVKAKMKNYTDWNVLGFAISQRLSTHWWDVPVLTGIKPADVSTDDLASFCSTVASLGSSNHFLMEGISPEGQTREQAFGGDKPKEKITIGEKEMKEVYDRWPPTGNKPEIVQMFAGGSLHSIYQVARMVEGKKVHKDVTFMVGMTLATRAVADRIGLTNILQAAGVELEGKWKGERVGSLWTTARKLGIKTVVTDSCKNTHYMGQEETEMVLLPLDKCVKVALTGSMEV